MTVPKIYLLNRTTSAGNTLIGIFIGLLLGFVIAAAIAIYMSKAPFPFTQKERERSQRQDRVGKAESPAVSANSATKAAEKSAEAAKARLDPITMNAGKDGTVPAVAEPSKSGVPKLETATAEPVKADSKQEPAKALETFVLQAGSFQNPADADNQKAKLALIGLEANIEPVDLPDRGTWYRVRLGPYGSLAEVNHVRAQLASGGIDASLMRGKRN